VTYSNARLGPSVSVLYCGSGVGPRLAKGQQVVKRSLTYVAGEMAATRKSQPRANGPAVLAG